jgi:hypothetical protein
MGDFPVPLGRHRIAMLPTKIVSCIGAIHKGP